MGQKITAGGSTAVLTLLSARRLVAIRILTLPLRLYPDSILETMDRKHTTSYPVHFVQLQRINEEQKIVLEQQGLRLAAQDAMIPT